MTSSLRFELPAEHPKERVDKVIASLVEGVSRATVQVWIEEGRVSRSGVALRARDRVGPGDVIDVEPGVRPSSRAEPDPTVAIVVVFEDEQLIVVDKPAGMVVHPARGHSHGTLINGLLARPGFARLPVDPRDPSSPLRPGVVHRIDKDTSGLLVVAKTEAAREALSAQLAAHTVERRYWAITVGVPTGGEIRSLYSRHPQSRLRFTSKTTQGKLAVTHVRVEEVLAGGAAALVSCRLETGRTHQIRVHLSERARTPLLGDLLYGGAAPERVRGVAEALGRQALHAGTLGFVHPTTSTFLRFETPIPGDMQQAIVELRAARA